MVELFHNTKKKKEKKNVRRCIVKYTEQHASLLYCHTQPVYLLVLLVTASTRRRLSQCLWRRWEKKNRSQSEHSEELGKENTPTKFSSTRKKQANSEGGGKKKKTPMKPSCEQSSWETKLCAITLNCTPIPGSFSLGGKNKRP